MLWARKVIHVSERVNFTCTITEDLTPSLLPVFNLAVVHHAAGDMNFSEFENSFHSLEEAKRKAASLIVVLEERDI